MICSHCDNPTAAGLHLCTRCTQQLTETLETAPALTAELEVTTAKLDNHGGNGGAPGFQASAPVRLSALEAGRHLDTLIVSWAVMLRDYDTRPEHAREKTALEFLTGGLPEIRRHDWSGPMLSELTEATGKARRLIDAPRDIRILGKCLQMLEDLTPCDQPLKVDGQQPETVCPGCGTLYHTSLLEARNRRRARGELMTAPDARRFLKRHAGVSVTYDDIRNWMKRGRLPYALDRVTSRGRDTKLVYPGDVLQIHLNSKSPRLVA